MNGSNFRILLFITSDISFHLFNFFFFLSEEEDDDDDDEEEDLSRFDFFSFFSFFSLGFLGMSEFFTLVFTNLLLAAPVAVVALLSPYLSLTLSWPVKWLELFLA